MQEAIAQEQTAVNAVRTAYEALLAPLDPGTRRIVLRGNPELVDPFFPGVDVDEQRVFFYSVAALRARAKTACASAQDVPATQEGVNVHTFLPATRLMPETIFWRLGRLALEGSVTPAECAQLLVRLQTLGDCVSQYATGRGRLWYASGLAPDRTHEGQAPPFPYPPPQELDTAAADLAALASHTAAR